MNLTRTIKLGPGKLYSVNPETGKEIELPFTVMEMTVTTAHEIARKVEAAQGKPEHW